MSKTKTIKIGALNITTHPHSTADYVRLFQEASRLKGPVNYWGNYFAKIGYLNNIDSRHPEKGLSGYIRRFLDVDKSKPWLNTLEDKEAAKEDMKELNWPDNLKPHFTSARFIFFPEVHHLFFESLTEVGEPFSPISVKKIFDNMFKTKVIKNMFEEINVVVSPSKEPIERIFSLPNLRRLEISLLRPNDDDLESDEAKILEKLEMEHAKRKDVILTAIPRDGIVPNEETKILARVASHNGYVKANGYDEDDEKVFISTKDHPWEHTVQFDPTQTPGLDVFKQTVSEIAPNFKRKNNNN